MPAFRNPTDLIGLSHDPALSRLLRACGVEEAYISGGASDMDKFLAVAEAMPLCEGHAECERVHRLLWDATGLTERLCPHTAHAFWEAWVERHWFAREGGDTPSEREPSPRPCPLCIPREPRRLARADVACLPAPAALRAENLGAWTRAWETELAGGGELFLLDLPDEYRFNRPDPYHAGEAIRKCNGGEGLSAAERDLLLTQALRVFGQWALRADGRGTLILCGGAGEEIARLLAYLQSSKALAPMMWLTRVPDQAAAVSGLYACVRTGLDLTDAENGEICAAHTSAAHMCAALMDAYRQVAPLGAAVLLQ